MDKVNKLLWVYLVGWVSLYFTAKKKRKERTVQFSCVTINPSESRSKTNTSIMRRSMYGHNHKRFEAGCDYCHTSAITPQNHTCQGVQLKVNFIPLLGFDQWACYYTFCMHIVEKKSVIVRSLVLLYMEYSILVFKVYGDIIYNDDNNNNN